VSELEFNVPFQHKHGYIRDEIDSVNEYGGNDEILAKILALALASASSILASFIVNVKINSNAVNIAT